MDRQERLRLAILQTVDNFCAKHQPRSYWLSWWLRAGPSAAGEQMIRQTFARLSA